MIDALQKRRLAGPARADDGHHVASFHGEIDAVQDLGAPVGQLQVLDLEHFGSQFLWEDSSESASASSSAHSSPGSSGVSKAWQVGEVRLAVLDEERPDDAAREAVGTFADRRECRP